MTILYKVNNANSQSFNSTLSERMALIESLSLVFKLYHRDKIVGQFFSRSGDNSLWVAPKL